MTEETTTPCEHCAYWGDEGMHIGRADLFDAVYHASRTGLLALLAEKAIGDDRYVDIISNWLWRWMDGEVEVAIDQERMIAYRQSRGELAAVGEVK